MNFSSRLSEAIEQAQSGNWEQLHRLASEIHAEERRRNDATAHLRHEVGNLLSIAQANVEAMIDGVVQATPERLDGIREAMVLAGDALNGFKGL